MTWRDAFLKQALSDYRVYRQLQQLRKVPLCHRLHYLQMTTEKLSKALLCSSGGDRPGRLNHAALGTALAVIKRRPDVRRILGFEQDYRAFCAYIDSLTDMATRIEKLAPTLKDMKQPNPEYPWEDAAGVRCPSEYAFPELPKVDLVRFQGLVCSLFRVFGVEVA